MSLTLAEFVTKYDGKRVSGYSESGGQCVDLVRTFLKDQTGDPYYGIPAVPGGAKDMFAKADPRKWRKVKNTPPGVPPAGAIVVFDAHPGNSYGHVAIALRRSDAHNVQSFDQNWSRYRRCTKEWHRYERDRVIGWLIRR